MWMLLFAPAALATPPSLAPGPLQPRIEPTAELADQLEAESVVQEQALPLELVFRCPRPGQRGPARVTVRVVGGRLTAGLELDDEHQGVGIVDLDAACEGAEVGRVPFTVTLDAPTGLSLRMSLMRQDYPTLQSTAVWFLGRTTESEPYSEGRYWAYKRDQHAAALESPQDFVVVPVEARPMDRAQDVPLTPIVRFEGGSFILDEQEGR